MTTRPADWPVPNFVNPETRVTLLIGVEAAMVSVATLVVLLRFFARTFVRRVLGWDDWVMALAMGLSIAATVLHCMATQWATGFHIWDIRRSWVEPTWKITFATQVMFAPTASLTKISICLTYLRTLPSASDRMFAKAAIAFSVLYCISIMLVNIFQCYPVNRYWSFQGRPYTCIDQFSFTIAAQALNSLSDFCIFLWPARTLSTVRIPLKQRLGLIFTFSVGVLVCIAGVCRIWYLVVFFNSYDTFYEGAMVFILAAIEMNAGIVCGSLPGIKPLLAACFPPLFGSGQCGSGGRSGSHTYTRRTGSRRSEAWRAHGMGMRMLPGARMSIRVSGVQDGRHVRLPECASVHSVRSGEEVEVVVKMVAGGEKGGEEMCVGMRRDEVAELEGDHMRVEMPDVERRGEVEPHYDRRLSIV
ncbi:hypothetical protein EJ06DRAFT_558411 [Trichodelitschia bisporula]|uniref:Rhodopsin domain-containing protein n=1 Tax=Trichodelitschia bisporula TaxID=703511 RepID=A0A6G1HQG0_9PEZI|nr:hypothetical protein EJ06DRAFT_558411 [Trichodelitschia bisporula]